jgi:hypothetical protein
MKFIRLSLATLFLLVALPSLAMTPIQWRNDAFEHATQIAVGKSIEVCGEIESRTKIEWQFSASDALYFDIHRHAGNDVVYNTRSYRTKEQRGTLSQPNAHEWCWMWTNETGVPVSVRVQMKRD